LADVVVEFARDAFAFSLLAEQQAALHFEPGFLAIGNVEGRPKKSRGAFILDELDRDVEPARLSVLRGDLELGSWRHVLAAEPRLCAGAHEIPEIRANQVPDRHRA